MRRERGAYWGFVRVDDAGGGITNGFAEAVRIAYPHSPERSFFNCLSIMRTKLAHLAVSLLAADRLRSSPRCVLILAVMWSWAAPGLAQSTIKIRAFIDGRSHLILDGDTARWHHLDYDAPGRHNCEEGFAEFSPGLFGGSGGGAGSAPLLGAEATFINGSTWLPEWADIPDCANTDCDCESLNTYAGIVPPLPEAVYGVCIDEIECRWACSVVEEPSAANGYRVVIEFDDNPIPSAAWYEIDLLISSARVEVYLGDGGSPLAGAKIEIAPAGTSNWQDPAAGQALYTDEDGIACIVDLDTPGSYHVRAVALHEKPESLGTHQAVHNYPSWDPSLVFELGNGMNPEIPPIKFPYPVFLQGGLKSGLGAWSGVMVPFLRKDPATDSFKRANHLPAFLCFPVPSKNAWPVGDGFIGGYDAGLPGEAAHEFNAVILANWMQSAVSSLVQPFPNGPTAWIPGANVGSLRFDVICHSMGGLITRALATGGDPLGAQIRRVVSLDGVHAGTAWAPYAVAAGFNEKFLNGWDDVVDSYPAWNASHRELDSSPLYLLYSCAATPNYACWDLRNNKIVNPDKSAFGVGRHHVQTSGTTFYTEQRFILGPQVAVPENHTTINQSIARARECADFLTTGRKPQGAVLPDAVCVSGPTCIPDLSCPDWLPTGPAVEPGDLAGRCILPSTSTQCCLIPFDSNTSITCQLMLTGAGGSYAFKDSLGTLLPWTLLDNQQLGNSTTLDVLEFSAPPVGVICLELTSTTDDLDVVYNFSYSNGRQIRAATPPGSIAGGSPLDITANFQDCQGAWLVGTGGTVSARIDGPGGTTTTLQLLDDGLSGDGATGDGLFGASFGGTLVEGIYAIAVEGQTSLGAESLARSTDVFAAVAATGAQLVGPPGEALVDVDGDGLIEALELRQLVSFTKNGTYRVLGQLETAAGGLIADLRLDTERTTGPGNAEVVLSVSAEQLAEAGLDGPWTLAGRSIASVEANFLTTDSGAAHLTQSYSLVQFEAPPEPEPTGLIPANGPEAGGYSVFLQGLELDNVDGVFIDGVPATFVVHNENSIEVVIPPMAPATGPLPTSRWPVDVRITTAWHDLTFEDAFSYGRNLLQPR